MAYLLEPGDVFLTRGRGVLSRLVRFFTRSIGESRTKVNHVGLVVESGDLRHCVVVEALVRVRRHRLWSRYGPPRKDDVAVYRPRNLRPAQLQVILAEAEEQVGRRYGVLKLLAHFLDWLLLGAYLFRRLTDSGDYPICSWLVAHAFAKAGLDFGVKPGAASPDDVWDFVTSHPRRYVRVRPLSPLGSPDGQGQR